MLQNYLHRLGTTFLSSPSTGLTRNPLKLWILDIMAQVQGLIFNLAQALTLGLLLVGPGSGSGILSMYYMFNLLHNLIVKLEVEG